MMKKSYILGAVLLLSACAGMDLGNTSASDSTSSKMKACMLSEANSRYQAGTLFTNSIKSTATELVKSCMQRLALQSAGISEQSQSTAESIIANLKSMAAAQ